MTEFSIDINKASISLVGGDVGGFKLKVKGLSKNQKVKFTTSNIKVAWFNIKKSNQKKGYVYVVGDKPGNAVVTAKIGKTKLTCKIKVTSPVKGAKMIIPSQLRNVGSDYGGRFSVSNAKFHWTHLGYELRFKVAMLSEESNIPNYNIYRELNTFSTYVAFLDKNDKVLNAVSNYNIGFLGTSGHASLSSEEYDRSGEVFSGVGDTKEYCVTIFHGVLGKVKKVVFLANPFDPCDYTGLKLPDKAYEDITVVSPTPAPTANATSTPTATPTPTQRPSATPTPTQRPSVTPAPTPTVHQHRDCIYCSGKGKITCATCNGKGQVHYPCAQCNSTGYYTYMDGTKEVCNACKLKMVTCMDCLGGHGTLTCKYCEGTGEYSNVCFNCKGAKTYLCRYCRGSKSRLCPYCFGLKYFSYYSTIKHGIDYDPCTTCGATGSVFCTECDNNCITVCPECGGTGIQ